MGKHLELFSEIASTVLLLKYVFVVVLFHGIKPEQHHLFGMIMCLQ